MQPCPPQSPPPLKYERINEDSCFEQLNFGVICYALENKDICKQNQIESSAFMEKTDNKQDELVYGMTAQQRRGPLTVQKWA